jgi:hypothetical protein
MEVETQAPVARFDVIGGLKYARRKAARSHLRIQSNFFCASRETTRCTKLVGAARCWS